MTQKKKTGTSSTRVARKTLPELSPQRKKVAVLFAVNNGYALYLGVARTSLVEHVGKREYELIVLYQDLSERNRELLGYIVDQFGCESSGSFRLRFMEMPVNLADYDFAPPVINHSLSRAGTACLLRVFSLNTDKILWLDSDILVRDDVAKLYATDLGDNWIAACRWIMASSAFWNVRGGKSSPNRNLILPKCWGVKRPKENYVNADVMLFNLRVMREHGVQEKLLQAAQNPDMYYHDQCAINMVCQGHIHYIDSEWNGLVSYNPNELPLKYRKKALADRKNRKIIHWAGSTKPWRRPLVLGADEWWVVARRTPYYEQILYTNICGILRGEMNKKFTKLGKSFLEQL